MTNEERFKIGRRFASTLGGLVFKIDNVDLVNGILYVTDDESHQVRVFIQNFDDWHYFVDDVLPEGLKLDTINCECGSDKYYGSTEGNPHSDYCPKAFKGIAK